MRELVLQSSVYKDESYDVDHLLFIWSEDNSVYYTQCPPDSKITLQDLDPADENCRKVLPEHRFARWKDSFTQMQHQNTAGYYLKSPHLFGYDGTPYIAEQFAEEIETMELLSRNPHRNVITYHGCERDGDLATGIWLDRHDYTLYDLVEGKVPVERQVIISSIGSFSNSSKGSRRPSNIMQIIRGIQAGLDHVHSLGLVHEDITPANILLDKDNQPVIIDFGCCVRQGQKSIGGTPDWSEFAETAEFENDFYGLELIRKWLEVKYLPMLDHEESMSTPPA